jgi:hypothetical protein
MPRGFKGARLDTNHEAIAAALEKLPGVTVQSLAAVGGGVPDLLVGVAGRNLLLEVKPDGTITRDKRRWVLNDNEEKWHAVWRGQRCVVRTADEAVAVVTKAMQEAA